MLLRVGDDFIVDRPAEHVLGRVSRIQGEWIVVVRSILASAEIEVAPGDWIGQGTRLLQGHLKERASERAA